MSLIYVYPKTGNFQGVHFSGIVNLYHFVNSLRRAHSHPLCAVQLSLFYVLIFVVGQSSVNTVKIEPLENLITVLSHPRHLPLYLVAAFAKRIARLALTAPPNGMLPPRA